MKHSLKLNKTKQNKGIKNNLRFKKLKQNRFKTTKIKIKVHFVAQQLTMNSKKLVLTTNDSNQQQCSIIHSLVVVDVGR